MDEAVAFLKSQGTPNNVAAAEKKIFKVETTTLSRRFIGVLKQRLYTKNSSRILKNRVFT
jgi:hypothetical protein